jgi:glutathione peroxidase
MDVRRFFDFQVAGIDGTPDLLGPLRGNVILAVNVASRCGFTPQYAGLQKLHEETAYAGFAVVGFPCNQFGSQEPGSNADIQKFCVTRYDVAFPLAGKIELNGPGRDPLYAWLTAWGGVANAGDVTWNFEKFLIARDGRILRRYPPATKPTDAGLLGDIVAALEQTPFEIDLQTSVAP